MKRYLIVVSISLFISGCAGSVVTKNFKVIADPPDAVIRISGVDQKEQKYGSPAAITVELPQEPALAARAVLEVSKDKFKPFTKLLRHIDDGATIIVKLEQIVSYRLKYRLLRPVQSDEIKLKDGAVSIAFTIGEQAFQMSLTNLAAVPLKIHWEQAEYTDIFGKRDRLMHSGVKYEDRNNPISDQVVMSRASIQEALTPISNVYVSSQTRGYEVKPLFPRDAGSGLKGRTFNLFIPVEINRAITSYNFTIEITDAVKEATKK